MELSLLGLSQSQEALANLFFPEALLVTALAQLGKQVGLQD